MNDLVVKIETLKDITPIKFNKEALEKKIDEIVKVFSKKDYKITCDDDRKAFKKDRAALNNYVKILENGLKKKKEEILSPFNELKHIFTNYINRFIGLSNNVDCKIKEAEEKQKKIKEANLMHFFGNVIEGKKLGKVITYSQIENERWYNLTFKEEEANQEILNKVVQIENDLQVINELKSEFDVQIKDVYFKNLVLSEALQEKTRLEALKVKISQNKKSALNTNIKTENETINKETGEVIQQREIPDIHIWRIEIQTTVDKKDIFKKCLDDNKIKWKVIG
jgi:hypothetical protein